VKAARGKKGGGIVKLEWVGVKASYTKENVQT